MDVCPKCGRKLLSHTSSRCNWCGEDITNPEYLKQAEANRAAYFLHDRLEAEAERARIGAIGPIFGTGIGGGPMPGEGIFGAPPYTPRVPQVPPLRIAHPAPGATPSQEPEQADTSETPPTPEDETAERARHLEF